jgi:GT2 family glycosyltransferase
VGFGAANNQALKVAHGELFLMLNTDAFLHQGCCQSLVDFMDCHKEAGVVGARLLNEDGTLQVSCFPFPTPFRAWIENLWIPKVLPSHWEWGDYRHWKHDEVREVDWVVGACLICRREAVQAVGGFDPRFFMYQEETDWQQRIRRSGWKIYFTPLAVATHLGGASGTRDPWTINRYFYTSMDKYGLKHHGVIGCLLVRLAIMVGILLRVPAWALAYCLHRPSRGIAIKKIRHYLWLLDRQVRAPIPRRQVEAS